MPYRLDIARISNRQPFDADQNASPRPYIFQVIKPFSKNIGFPDLHNISVAFWLQLSMGFVAGSLLQWAGLDGQVIKRFD